MPRLTLALVALSGILAGGLVTSLMRAPADETAIRAVIDQALAERGQPVAAAELDAAKLNPMIEDYLMSNPRILERVTAELQTQLAAEKRSASRAAIASISDQIYNDPDHVVLGNPNGDVTLVEMFDYNCGYCRQALPDLATLMAEDPNLRVILKEFPILSQDSMDAAQVAVLVGRSDVDYWAFHEALFTGRGQVTGETALQAAESLGLNKVSLSMDLASSEVRKVIEKSYAIAETLDVTGTPTYILGDEVIQGAIGLEGLRTRIANMRACGATQCPPGG